MNAFLLVAALAVSATPVELIAQLSDPARSAAAVEALLSMSPPPTSALVEEASKGHDLAARGWCIVALSRITGPEVDVHLARLWKEERQPALVRTWAAAGAISRVKDLDGLVNLRGLPQSFAALRRPYTLKATELVAQRRAPVEKLLRVAANDYLLQQALLEPILEHRPYRSGRRHAPRQGCQCPPAGGRVHRHAGPAQGLLRPGRHRRRGGEGAGV